ncbi:MAG: hypothetical protein IJ151_02200 [Bacteroidales bacterium]|nr:hypothetical protein [Bacteroidales bacterium]
MKKFGLMGSDISHSGSPDLFRTAYGGKWPYDIIEGADFQALWKRFLSGYEGINITAPFKEKAFAQIAALTADGLGALSGPAFRAGAVNLAVKQLGPDSSEIIYGDNSDFSAVILGLAEACFPEIVSEFRREFGADFVKRVHQFFRQQFSVLYPGGGQALVVGCGGAGRAAAVAAAELGFDVILTNRTQARAADFAMSLPEYGFAICGLQDLKAAVKSCDVIIYAASAHITELSDLEIRDFEKIGPHHPKIVVEANYKNPSIKDAILMNVLRAGGIHVSGLDWLRLQALAGFPLLTGTLPNPF